MPGEQQVVREADHGSRSDGMLTSRTRSAACTGTWFADVLDLEARAPAHRQRDGRDDRDQQHDRGELERIDVLGVEHGADLGGVARPFRDRRGGARQLDPEAAHPQHVGRVRRP